MNDLLLNRDNISPQQVETSNILNVSGTFDAAQAYTELWMKDGRVLRLPTSLLVEHKSKAAVSNDASGSSANVAATMIPIVEETLTVGKRVVETARVRVHKTVQEHQEILDEPLAIRTYDVERIILNHPVDLPPTTREEGDTTIYPVIEEQLILTKQLILKEEIRVTRRDTERRDNQVVTLHREHVQIERIPKNAE